PGRSGKLHAVAGKHEEDRRAAVSRPEVAERREYPRALRKLDYSRRLGSAFSRAPAQPRASGALDHGRIRPPVVAAANSAADHVLRARSAQSARLGRQFSKDRAGLENPPLP